MWAYCAVLKKTSVSGHSAQTLTGHFSFTPKDGFYVWLYYTINGKFSNHLTATAKSIFTVPQQVSYTNYARLRFSHISMGWKHYLKGGYNTEEHGIYMAMRVLDLCLALLKTRIPFILILQIMWFLYGRERVISND